MAKRQWGKVYLHERFAGVLAEEPGGRFVFTYDESYLDAGLLPVSLTLPVRAEPHYCEKGLHPYFDNLVAEGWLRDAQARALDVGRNDRFALLLAFGKDCIGAVSIIDPEPAEIRSLNLDDPEEMAALAGRASLSGVQPKMTANKTQKGYMPATQESGSTHIAKLPSSHLTNILELELLTLRATKILLPNDHVVEAELAPIGKDIPKALLIQRFDRLEDGSKKHFEEFNQIFGRYSEDKYHGTYEEMGQFILKTPSCVPAQVDTLYRRILAAVLTGNIDAHFKNFALFHTTEGLRLTPSYDLVAAATYKELQAFALSIAGVKNIKIGDIKPKHLVLLGESYGLSHMAIELAVNDLEKQLEKAKEIIYSTEDVSNGLKDKLIKLMEKRWSGTFKAIGKTITKVIGASTGKHLSKQPSRGAKLSDFLSND